METKISMKTIYLILVITIGLVGLGVGSTFAVFTATAEIANPITLKSDLTYNDDIFDTADITIGPGESRDANVGLYNEGGVNYFYYAVWYIYDGSDGDITFTRNAIGTIMPNGVINGDSDGVVGLKIKNNTSNTITITVGVATSKDNIVLPNYMRLVTYTESTTYSLTLSKEGISGVNAIYYKINGSNTYEMTTDNSITLNVNSGSTYYYYGVPQTGYTMNSCTSSNPCSGTMTSSVTKTLTASTNSYNLTLNIGTGVSKIYYKINGASSYTSSMSNKTLSVKYGTTYYYYGVAFDGYTMNSCTSSSPCSGIMGTSAVTKSLTATADSYNLTLRKGTGVSTIYYKINGASSYTSSTFNIMLNVKYGTTYYYYGVASTGYIMNSCTSSSPCSGTMGTSAVTKLLTATASGSYTVTLKVDSELKNTSSVSAGSKYEWSFTSPTSNMSCSCTNNQTCSIEPSSRVTYMFIIDSVTATTTCDVTY